jgi:integrase
MLKNKQSPRLVPVHSELVRLGFLDYVRALPQDGLLFPGLKRRDSKGGKIGARVGELFRKKLVALGIKRERLCFHSFRHTLTGRLDQAGVAQTDADRLTGHKVKGITYGVYSTGPGLKRLAGAIEAVRYDDVPILSK